MSDESEASSGEPFLIWVNGPKGNALARRGAVIKDGPQVTKTVEYGLYGRRENPKRQLQFHRFEKGCADDGTVADPRRRAAWSCENDEVDKLLAFLHSDVARTGRYQVVDRESPAAALLALLSTNEIGAQSVVDALTGHPDIEGIITRLAGSDRGLSAAQSAVLSRRRELVRQLRRLVNDPATTETKVQALIGNAYWIFGGRYVGVAERRNLTMLDQHDIPLLGSDGTLHVCMSSSLRGHVSISSLCGTATTGSSGLWFTRPRRRRRTISGTLMNKES